MASRIRLGFLAGSRPAASRRTRRAGSNEDSGASEVSISASGMARMRSSSSGEVRGPSPADLSTMGLFDFFRMAVPFSPRRGPGADDPRRPRPARPADPKDDVPVVWMRTYRDVSMFSDAMLDVVFLEVEDVGPVVPEDLRRGPERDSVFLAVGLFLPLVPAKSVVVLRHRVPSGRSHYTR